MNPKWSVEKIDVVDALVDRDEMNRALDEFAEIVYLYFCQLDKNQIQASSNLAPKTRE